MGVEAELSQPSLWVISGRGAGMPTSCALGVGLLVRLHLPHGQLPERERQIAAICLIFLNDVYETKDVGITTSSSLSPRGGRHSMLTAIPDQVPTQPFREPARVSTQLADSDSLEYLRISLTRYWTAASVGSALRRCLDQAIDFPNTGFQRVEQIEKSAKTAIGTQVEVSLRNLTDFPHGDRLDLRLPNGGEADIKWSTGQGGKTGTSWMVPTEAFGFPVILVSAWDTPGASYFSIGLLNVDADGGNLSKPNKDQKQGVPKATQREALWIFWEEEMPRNILLDATEESLAKIHSNPPGVLRMAEALTVFPSLSVNELAIFDEPDPEHRYEAVKSHLRGRSMSLGRDDRGQWVCSQTG